MKYICLVSIYRKQKNISQEKLANALGITRKTLSLIENGTTMPKLDIAFKISEKLNTNIYELWKKFE